MRKLITSGIAILLISACKHLSPNGSYVVYRIDDHLWLSDPTYASMLKNKYTNATFILSFEDKYLSLKEDESSKPMILSKSEIPKAIRLRNNQKYSDSLKRPSIATYHASFEKVIDSLRIDLTLSIASGDTVLNISATSLKAIPHHTGDIAWNIPKEGSINCYLSKAN